MMQPFSTSQVRKQSTTPSRNATPTETFIQMEKRTESQLARRPLWFGTPSEAGVNPGTRAVPTENPFVVKYRHASGVAGIPKSPDGLANTYSNLSPEALEKARDRLQPGSKTAVRLKYDIPKRTSKTMAGEVTTQLSAAAPPPIPSAPGRQTSAPCKDTSPSSELQSMRDQPLPTVASSNPATPHMTSPSSALTNNKQDRFSFGSADKHPRNIPPGIPEGQQSPSASQNSTTAVASRKKDAKDVTEATEGATALGDLRHPPPRDGPVTRSRRSRENSLETLEDPPAPAGRRPISQACASTPVSSLVTPVQRDDEQTGEYGSSEGQEGVRSSQGVQQNPLDRPLEESSERQGQLGINQLESHVSGNQRQDEAQQVSDPHTQPQRIGDTTVIPFVNVAEEDVPPKEKFQREQEWLQVPSLFYLFANIIELQELLQHRRMAEAKEMRKRNGSMSSSLASSWDGEREAQLVNSQKHIAYSVFEVDGILLNPFFARWSQPGIRSVVSNVIDTWKKNGPESLQFDRASLELVDTISADASGSVTFTYLFILREWVGDLTHLIPMCIILGVMVVIGLLCIVLLGVFGRHHLAACIALSVVLGIDIIVFFGLSMLVAHHNAYADATATFFREEALTLTKTFINQDAEDADNSFNEMQSVMWSTPTATERGFGGEGDDRLHRGDRRGRVEGDEGYVSMIGRSMQPEDPEQRELLEKDRQNALLMTSLNYDKHQQNVQHHQEQVIRQHMDVSHPSAENNAHLLAGLSEDISITALIWCFDGAVTGSIVSSLWQHNFLVFSGTLPVLDNVYRHGSERFKILLFHADDFTKGSGELDTVLSWMQEKRPVFFFSRDVGSFPAEVPVSKRLEVPFTERDLHTLLLSGIGIDEEVNPTPQPAQPFRVPPYILGRRLGGGAYGNVFEAEMEESGAKCAVKRMYLREDEEDGDGEGAGPSSQLREIAQEVEIMSSLYHPNIVKYMFCERDDNCISIFMELCSGGSLLSLINDGELTDPAQVRHILTDIISAVAYLHEKRIVHRDLKPDNVLFRDGRAKVTDFGTAVLKRDRGDLRLVKGTFAYMAPEILCGEPYGKACDVWSIGCIAAEVLCVDLPQRALGLPEMCEYYRKMDVNSALDIVCDVPTVKDFLCSCLQRNPASRMTAAELLQHDLLRQENTALNRWMETVNEKRRESHRANAGRTLGMNGSAFDLNSEANDSLQSSQILTPP